MRNGLPIWLQATFRQALLGEIYPQMRAIAVRYREGAELLIRVYLDRDPTGFDRESAEMIATNVCSAAEVDLFAITATETVLSDAPLRDVDPLDGFVYARREYDMDENPGPKA